MATTNSTRNTPLSKTPALSPLRVALSVIGLLFFFCFPVAAQPKKVPGIGYLSSLPRAAESSRIESFKRGLRELGYVEGKNIAIEYPWAEGKFDRLPELAAELLPNVLARADKIFR
jgi:putative tryptophan/tyrosine transport system substrate-binding protein